MTGAEVKKMAIEDLKSRLKAKRLELFQLRQKDVTEKVKTTHQFREMRGDIARMLGEINARRHAAAPKKAVKPVAPAAAPARTAPRTPRVAKKASTK